MAEILGVSTQAVCFWRDGKRRLPIEHCSAIERATNGGVTRRDLRPLDWQDIWPELAQPAASPAPSAPIAAVPVAAAAPAEDEARLVQPADISGDAEDKRRLWQRRISDDGEIIQTPDIDGEAEETRAPATALAALTAQANAANGTVPPPPGFSGQDENGRPASPAAPAYQADDGEPLLVLEETDRKES